MNQTEISTVPEWITETTNDGSHPKVDLHNGSNGWLTPPGDVFPLRSTTYFTNKQKSPGGNYLLTPAGVDWLKSTAKLDHIMAHPDNCVAQSLRKAQSRGESLNNTIFSVNFQIPSKEPYSLVLYFAAEEPILSDSILHRFINGNDDSFRNERFKLVTQVVNGPQVVRSIAAKYGAFVISKAVNCKYYRGTNYFEIDVDFSSSVILKALVRFVFGYVTSLAVDVGLVVEAQAEDELPERLIGAVRLCQMELSSATAVLDSTGTSIK